MDNTVNHNKPKIKKVKKISNPPKQQSIIIKVFRNDIFLWL